MTQAIDERTSRQDPTELDQTLVVLDTSVLVADPDCLADYASSDVVLPLTVVEELDGLKSRTGEVGRAARAALREIEDLRMLAGGSLAEPVAVAGGGSVQIEVNGLDLDRISRTGLDASKADNRIIGAALGRAGRQSVALISNDAALRIKAAHLGLVAHPHEPTKSAGPPPSGWSILDVSADTIDRLYDVGTIAADTLGASVNENGFCVLKSGSQSALARCRSARMQVLTSLPPTPWNLRPRSTEQRFALDLLLDPDVSVVALDGRAGSGKTIMAVAAGLEQVVERSAYEHLAVYRPLVPVGRADVGYLPGDLDDKLDPWMAAIHDAIVALTDRRSHEDARRVIDGLTSRNMLSFESVTFLRGRTLHAQFVIVDEAQNLEPTTLKTILTRTGEGTKIVFTGDTSQIDAPYLGAGNNALALLMRAFSGSPHFGGLNLVECERSAIASLAAELL